MKVLLHICCGVCASSCVETLRKAGHTVSGYFYNPNIYPRKEYAKRLQTAKKISSQQGFPLLVGEYNPQIWDERIKGWENESEGGRRCSHCFRLRFEQTKKKAQENNFDAFTTTLTVSPHKNSKIINDIGGSVSSDLFLASDFKKQDGAKRAQELAKESNLYRQHYCGCIYSMKKRRNNE